MIPGFGLTLGVSLVYLCLIALIPLSMVGLKAFDLGWTGIRAIALDPRTLHALAVSFGTALAAATINVVFGALLAWIPVRYRFPGRRILDALVDLPFALPTAVAGISLAALYAPNGWIGGLLTPLGIKIAYTRLGIVVALIFIGLPFVVRTVPLHVEILYNEYNFVAAFAVASLLALVTLALKAVLETRGANASTTPGH